MELLSTNLYPTAPNVSYRFKQLALPMLFSLSFLLCAFQSNGQQEHGVYDYENFDGGHAENAIIVNRVNAKNETKAGANDGALIIILANQVSSDTPFQVEFKVNGKTQSLSCLNKNNIIVATGLPSGTYSDITVHSSFGTSSLTWRNNVTLFSGVQEGTIEGGTDEYPFAHEYVPNRYHLIRYGTMERSLVFRRHAIMFNDDNNPEANFKLDVANNDASSQLRVLNKINESDEPITLEPMARALGVNTMTVTKYQFLQYNNAYNGIDLTVEGKSPNSIKLTYEIRTNGNMNDVVFRADGMVRFEANLINEKEFILNNNTSIALQKVFQDSNGKTKEISKYGFKVGDETGISLNVDDTQIDDSSSVFVEMIVTTK